MNLSTCLNSAQENIKFKMKIVLLKWYFCTRTMMVSTILCLMQIIIQAAKISANFSRINIFDGSINPYQIFSLIWSGPCTWQGPFCTGRYNTKACLNKPTKFPQNYLCYINLSWYGRGLNHIHLWLKIINATCKWHEKMIKYTSLSFSKITYFYTFFLLGLQQLGTIRNTSFSYPFS